MSQRLPQAELCWVGGAHARAARLSWRGASGHHRAVNEAGEPKLIENKLYDELAIGDSASSERTLTSEDIALFAVVSGDVNPAHLDQEFAATSRFHGVIAHGMWGGALISAVLGTKMPGPGTIYLGQDLRFIRPVRPGDRIVTTVTVKQKRDAKQIVVFECVCRNQSGEEVIRGDATGSAPAQMVRRPASELPEVMMRRRDCFDVLIRDAASNEPMPTAVCHPCSATALAGALEAREAGLIVPILVGPEHKIRAVGEQLGEDLGGLRIVDVEHSHAAADRSVALVRAGEAAAVMKGSLHTDELLSAILAKEGLRTDRRLSHVFYMDVPSYPRPIAVTDAAINIAPDLQAKRDICQNAIELMRALGVETPKVAILAAVETVMPGMPATLDAAALCKMADRGQIKGGLLDGPLAFDNAVSRQAAQTKGIDSAVAGFADVLVTPDLEAGNILAKQLIFLSGADAAGLVLGARAPVVLTSRADSTRARMASCAIALLYAKAKRERPELFK